VDQVPVEMVTRDVVAAMWHLYDEHYDNVHRSVFEADLLEKSSVFLARDAVSGTLVGFSTAMVYRHRYRGRDVGVYFSGDTVLRPAYWGQRALHQAVFTMLLRWKLGHPFTPLYWHLICSGYRTYLAMVRNFPTHWPNHLRTTPPWEARLIDSICRERFGVAWKPDSGVISFEGAQPVVKTTVAPLTPEVMALPEVAFFARMNPGLLAGDELAMIGRVDIAAVRSMVARALLPRRRQSRTATSRNAPASTSAQPARS
jgi:hypothetical protein